MSNLAGFIEERRKNLDYIAENAEELREIHGDKYIAVVKQEVVDSDEDELRLSERVRKAMPDLFRTIRKIDKVVEEYGL